jgi:hypothetical protein
MAKKRKGTVKGKGGKQAKNYSTKTSSSKATAKRTMKAARGY